MEVVVQMFQRLGLRSVLLTQQGALAGILTKMVRRPPRFLLLACIPADSHLSRRAPSPRRTYTPTSTPSPTRLFDDYVQEQDPEQHQHFVNASCQGLATAHERLRRARIWG